MKFLLSKSNIKENMYVEKAMEVSVVEKGVGREDSILLYITLGCLNCYNCLLLIETFNKNS